MAVRNYLRLFGTGWPPPGVMVGAGDITPTAGTSAVTATMATTSGGQEIHAIHGAWTWVFQTRRLAAPATLSSSLSLRHYAYADTASNSTIRVKVSKITLGGGFVESVIAQADAPTLPTTAGTLQTLTVPIVAPLEISTYERLIVRIFAVPLPGQTMGVGQVVFPFDAAADVVGDASIDLPDELTFLANRSTTLLIMRRTAANGIGNFFDMLETKGTSAFTTGVVSTTSGGTNIQWTRTAGGTPLEWISPRLKYGASLASAAPAFQLTYWAFESAAQANAMGRVRIFRRRGTEETQCLLATDNNVEFSLAATSTFLSSTSVGATVDNLELQEDDRLVLRMYITNFGTMASGRSCTINYDGPTVDANGYMKLLINLELFFKAESDPARVIIPDGLTMSGMGN